MGSFLALQFGSLANGATGILMVLGVIGVIVAYMYALSWIMSTRFRFVAMGTCVASGIWVCSKIIDVFAREHHYSPETGYWVGGFIGLVVIAFTWLLSSSFGDDIENWLHKRRSERESKAYWAQREHERID